MLVIFLINVSYCNRNNNKVINNIRTIKVTSIFGGQLERACLIVTPIDYGVCYEP